MTDMPVSILIVDDEPPLLRLMQMYLERLGYRVTARGDATAALEAFEGDPSRFQLVVADLSLPDLTGDQMALRMLGTNPSLRILLCSGYPFDTGTLPADQRPKFGVLQKPFLPNMLARCVEDLMKTS